MGWDDSRPSCLFDNVVSNNRDCTGRRSSICSHSSETVVEGDTGRASVDGRESPSNVERRTVTRLAGIVQADF
jgi:hypothetical protein